MAGIQSKSNYVQHLFVNEGDEEEKWAKHYSSNHRILLVGEGDFSFALSLAESFGSASNIVASTLDSYDDVIKKYKGAKINLEKLDSFGARLFHGIDATKMKLNTNARKFERIIYNFPHAGRFKEMDPKVIKMHQDLVFGFFHSASGMLCPNGEVHVTHKTKSPYNLWNIKELADQNGLWLTECVKFKLEDYPGYINKRGHSHRCDESFPIGKCSTFKFVLSWAATKPTNLVYKNPQKPQKNPTHTANASMVMNPAPVGNQFREYFDQVDDNLVYSFHNALIIGFERYKAENCGKPLSGYINLPEEIQNLSERRLALLLKRSLEIVRQHLLSVWVEPQKGSSSKIKAFA